MHVKDQVFRQIQKEKKMVKFRTQNILIQKFRKFLLVADLGQRITIFIKPLEANAHHLQSNAESLQVLNSVEREENVYSISRRKGGH